MNELTDGQLLYILANMALDREEELENICPECKKELEKKKCTICGKEISEFVINKNFDPKKFKELKRGNG